MAVQDDPAWPRWSKAHDALVHANDEFRRVSHLPDTDEVKREAWRRVQEARREYNKACDEIEPIFNS